MSGTIDSRSESRDSGPLATAPQLFRLLCADAPLAPPSRHELDGIDAVELGRAAHPSAARQGTRLVLGVVDARMSEQHARLRAMAGHWIVEDAGSKNGTRVNGARVDRAVVGDGDVLECGRTFFIVKHMPLDASAPPDITALAGQHAPAPAAPDVTGRSGVATLSPRFARELALLARVAPGTASLVLVGESGAGKEVLARQAHALSARRGAFVAVNCGALPASLIEGTLFGHRKGAFSGAVEDRPGLLRSADGGTLLLDEIADLPPAAQAALLRALQEREVLPLGATRPVPVDFRLIVCAQRPLEELAAAGTLRADLYARLTGCTIAIPPLRERIEDLALLLAAILPRCTAHPERVTLAPAAARVLVRHHWPLNVRELEKCLQAALAPGDVHIDVDDLPAALRRAPPATPHDRPPPDDAAVDEDRARRAALILLLREHRGNVSAVARAMQKDRVQVRRWLDRYALDAARYRDGDR